MPEVEKYMDTIVSYMRLFAVSEHDDSNTINAILTRGNVYATINGQCVVMRESMDGSVTLMIDAPNVERPEVILKCDKNEDGKLQISRFRWTQLNRLYQAIVTPQ